MDWQTILQLACACGLMLLVTLTHGFGLAGIDKLLKLEGERLEQASLDGIGITLMGAIALLLFGLHCVEIGLFAIFYLAVGAIEGTSDALHFSSSTYATLGRTAEFFSAEWRLVGSLEALVGFLMIGWSTAYLVSRFGKIRD